MQPFTELGRDIQARWRKRRQDPEAFAAIAHEALQAGGLHERVLPGDIVAWAMTTDPLPHQADLPAAFGQPPITLFADDLFYVSALFWVDGTTSIHQHSFSGAFQVLAGSSLHSDYRFALEDPVNDRLRLGGLHLHDAVLLGPGDSHPILSGDRFIHSLFHLDRPTVSIVVRTVVDWMSGPQFNYRRPGLALDPYYQSPTLLRALQCLALLLDTDADEARAQAARMVATRDPYTAYRVLAAVDMHKAGRGLFTALGDVLRQAHGELAPAMLASLAEARRLRALAARRAAVTDPEARFLLALMLNVPTRERTLDLLSRRYPDGDAVSRAMRCLTAILAAGAGAGASMTAAPPAGPELDLALDEPALWVVEELLRGRGEEAIQAAAARQGVAITPSRIAKLCFTLPQNSLFRTLLHG